VAGGADDGLAVPVHALLAGRGAAVVRAVSAIVTLGGHAPNL